MRGASGESHEKGETLKVNEHSSETRSQIRVAVSARSKKKNWREVVP